jgi:hypothetical protein
VTILLLLAPAWAASWADPVPLEDAVDETGRLPIPAGSAAILSWEGREPDVQMGDGSTPRLFGTHEGWIVGSALTSQSLGIVGDVTVRFLERRGDVAAWDDYDRAVRARPASAPPAPGEPVIGAAIRLRADALVDPDVVDLGTIHDLERVRPRSPSTHEIAPEPLAPTMRLEGPGTFTLRLTPTGPIETTLTVLRDGRPALGESVVSAGGLRSYAIWIPPGEHALTLSYDPALPWSGEMARLLFRTGRPHRESESPEGELAIAEQAWLEGNAPDARAAFLPHATDAGAPGDLARARLVALAQPDEDLGALLHADTADGLVVLTDALLARRPCAPPSIVAPLVSRAPEVDPVVLTAWLDSVPSARPGGEPTRLALPPVLADAGDAVALVGARSTRRTALPPVDPSAPFHTLVSPVGPGIPRLLLPASSTVTLPDAPPERFPLLRLRALDPARVTVDGVEMTLPPDRDLSWAMIRGAHAIEVRSGRVLLLDPEIAGEDVGTRMYERRLYAAPVTFALVPGALPVQVDVELDGVVSALVSGDDGVVRTVAAGQSFVASAGTRTLSIETHERAWVALASRTQVPFEAPLIAPPAPDVEADLAAIRDATLAIDAGDPLPRRKRALALADLGLVSLAREDAILWLRAHPVEDTSWVAHIGRRVPSRPRLGPADASTWAALHDLSLPEDSIGQTALLANAEDGAAAAIAGDLFRAEGQRVDAIAMALAAQDELQAATIASGLRWASVRPTSSAGLSRVAVELDPRPPATIAGRVKEALTTPPWPAGSMAVIEPSATLVVRPAPGRSLEVFCRDLLLAATPCTVAVRTGREWTSLRVPDGKVAAIDLSRGDESEIAVKDPEHALAVRLLERGRPAPLHAARRAIEASPTRPIVVTIARPAVLQIEVARGTLRVGGETISKKKLVALRGTGPGEVEIEGAGSAFLAVGTDPPPAAVDPPVVLDPDAAPPAPDLGGLVARARPLESTFPPVPGTVGSFDASLAVRRETVYSPTEASHLGEVSARFRRRAGTGLVDANAWAHASRDPSIGAAARGGSANAFGYAAAQLDLAAGQQAWHAVARLSARRDLALTPLAEAQGWLGLRGGLYEGDPSVADPAVVSGYVVDHPVQLQAQGLALQRLGRDLRIGAGLRAWSNSGPSLDRAGALARLDALFAQRTTAQLKVVLDRRFADADRAESDWQPRIDLRVDGDLWRSRSRSGTLFLAMAARPTDQTIEGAVGFRYGWSDDRGLRDLMPWDPGFASLREPR